MYGKVNLTIIIYYISCLYIYNSSSARNQATFRVKNIFNTTIWVDVMSLYISIHPKESQQVISWPNYASIVLLYCRQITPMSKIQSLMALYSHIFTNSESIYIHLVNHCWYLRDYFISKHPTVYRFLKKLNFIWGFLGSRILVLSIFLIQSVLLDWNGILSKAYGFGT